MRSLRIAAAAAALALLSTPPTTPAKPPRDRSSTPAAKLAYPIAWRTSADRIARHQWRRFPDYCPRYAIRRATIDPATVPKGHLGLLHYHMDASVTVCIGATAATIPGLTWLTYCTAQVHMEGHAVLGPRFFARTNPRDPAHSSWAGSFMNGRVGVIPPACRRPPQRAIPSGA